MSRVALAIDDGWKADVMTRLQNDESVNVFFRAMHTGNLPLSARMQPSGRCGLSRLAANRDGRTSP